MSHKLRSANVLWVRRAGNLLGGYESTLLLNEVEQGGEVARVSMPNVCHQVRQVLETRTDEIRSGISRLCSLVPAE